MSYRRVIPRDLFNEASLLKCYGQLYINLEIWGGTGAELVFLDEGGAADFDVCQDESDGSIFLTNVELTVRGLRVKLRRPLNSRGAYPLYLTTEADDVIQVFESDGPFTDEMKAFLAGDLPGAED